jgi:hypothetical protein
MSDSLKAQLTGVMAGVLTAILYDEYTLVDNHFTLISICHLPLSPFLCDR